MAGLDEKDAEDYADLAIKYDAKIAKVVKSTEEWADYPATYNPVSLTDFEAKFDSFKMDYFLGGLFTKKPERIISTEPRYLDHAEELLNEENFAEIKAWMLVKFINGVAYSLSQDFREAAFPFSQALSGQPELSSGVKQAYHITNGDSAK